MARGRSFVERTPMTTDPQAASGRRWILGACVALCLLVPTAVRAQETPAAPDDSVTTLRKEIEALRADYEQRISALEKRLSDLQAAQGQAPAPGTPETATAEATPPPETAPAPE